MSEQERDPGAPGTGAGAGRGAGRGVKIALAVSLALNLLVVGLVSGALLGRPGGGPDVPPALRTLGLGPFAVALGRDGRDGVRDRLAPQQEGLARERREIGGSLLALRRALLAEPFDRAAAEAALARSRRAGEALQARGHGAFLDTVAAMSQAERADLAARLDRAMRRMGDGPPPR